MDINFSIFFASAAEAWTSVPLVSLHLPIMGFVFSINIWAVCCAIVLLVLIGNHSNNHSEAQAGNSAFSGFRKSVSGFWNTQTLERVHLKWRQLSARSVDYSTQKGTGGSASRLTNRMPAAWRILSENQGKTTVTLLFLLAILLHVLGTKVCNDAVNSGFVFCATLIGNFYVTKEGHKYPASNVTPAEVQKILNLDKPPMLVLDGGDRKQHLWFKHLYKEYRGIYFWVLKNDMPLVYVGSSKDMCRRPFDHKKPYQKTSKKLNVAMNHFGLSSFLFVVPEILGPQTSFAVEVELYEALLIREHYYMQQIPAYLLLNFSMNPTTMPPRHLRKRRKRVTEDFKQKYVNMTNQCFAEYSPELLLEQADPVKMLYNNLWKTSIAVSFTHVQNDKLQRHFISMNAARIALGFRSTTGVDQIVNAIQTGRLMPHGPKGPKVWKVTILLKVPTHGFDTCFKPHDVEGIIEPDDLCYC